MQNGFIKVAAAIPSVKVADCSYNVQQIESLIAMAEGKGVEVIVFPELCITGYTCQDLFKQTLLLEQAETSVLMLLDFTRKLDIISIVGVPVVVGDLLLNCAAVIQKAICLGLFRRHIFLIIVSFMRNVGLLRHKICNLLKFVLQAIRL